MGGFALYDGDTFLTYLWDADHFNDHLSPDNVEVAGLEDQCELTMRIAVKLEGGDYQPGDMQTPFSNADMATAKEIYNNYSCLLEYLVANGYIGITGDEIRDRGNGDALSKSITALQAGWFILQCIARALQGLAVTELEIITFAFAILSFVTSFFWWHKPLRVRRPVRVMLRRQPIPKKKLPHTTRCKKVKSAFTRLSRAVHTLLGEISAYIEADYQTLSREIPFTFLRRRAFAPLYPFASLSAKYRDIIMGYDSDVCRYLFSSRLKRDRPRHRLALYPVSIIFSAIHCIPWFFTFPTLLEQALWRIAAVIVVASSISTGILHLGYHGLLHRIEASKKASRYLLVMLFVVAAAWYLLVFLQCIMYALYVVARLVVIAISLTALRDLPPTAYEAIQWSSFLPHIE
ncbi:hypothetical protein VNI00_013951 [Paramarasmius palmivorus]|uniref:Uncharacterized protein n=1 Tax=Paramarasmius palmivorus TaxID=297713 RepID=A0AAW0BXA7_9AGAR